MANPAPASTAGSTALQSVSVAALMRISNVTRGTTLADGARRADGFLARGRGLMLSNPLARGAGLVIDPCNSIHMFFMKFPLDVIFLDKSGKVVLMYRAIKPWRVGRIVRGGKLAIELPVGAIEGSGTQLGDEIRFD